MVALETLTTEGTLQLLLLLLLLPLPLGLHDCGAVGSFTGSRCRCLGGALAQRAASLSTSSTSSTSIGSSTESAGGAGIAGSASRPGLQRPSCLERPN
jgi:hypothetical protein